MATVTIWLISCSTKFRGIDMAFENLGKLTGFNPERITQHILTLNSLIERKTCSKDEQSSLMFLLGALTLTESYLMNLEVKEEAKITGLPVPKDVDKCKSCGAPIYWQRTQAGRWCPIDWPSGESHFKTCPQASRWSSNKNQGNSK